MAPANAPLPFHAIAAKTVLSSVIDGIRMLCAEFEFVDRDSNGEICYVRRFASVWRSMYISGMAQACTTGMHKLKPVAMQAG